MTTIGDAVVFTNVSLMFPLPVAAVLLMPDTTARLHANPVPLVPLVGV